MSVARRSVLLALSGALALAPLGAVRADPEENSVPLASRPLDLLVFGDSLAQGLALHMMAMVRRLTAVRVVNEALHATGITLYHQYDWQQKIDEVLAQRSFGAAAVWIGLNDFRPIVDSATRRRFRFESAEFADLYGARVEGLIRSLERAAVPVFWLGLPTIRHEANNRAIRRLTEIQRERATARHAVFLDTAEATAPGGTYTPVLPDGDQVVRIRAEDGSHFTPPGYRMVADLLLRSIGETLPQFAPAVAPVSRVPTRHSRRDAAPVRAASAQPE